jgi:hypothetical protein
MCVLKLGYTPLEKCGLRYKIGVKVKFTPKKFGRNEIVCTFALYPISKRGVEWKKKHFYNDDLHFIQGRIFKPKIHCYEKITFIYDGGRPFHHGLCSRV